MFVIGFDCSRRESSVAEYESFRIRGCNDDHDFVGRCRFGEGTLSSLFVGYIMASTNVRLLFIIYSVFQNVCYIQKWLKC